MAIEGDDILVNITLEFGAGILDVNVIVTVATVEDSAGTNPGIYRDEY